VIKVLVKLTGASVKRLGVVDPVGVGFVDYRKHVLVVVWLLQSGNHLLDFQAVSGELHAPNRGEVLGMQVLGLIVK
jgi:hypothetical protein